jgi:predicted RNase H-like HicB family nuclease
MLTYSLKLADRYDGMVIATIPDLPEAMAMGRDIDEACDEARRALESTLESYAAEGRPFPSPSACGALSVSTDRFIALQPV